MSTVTGRRQLNLDELRRLNWLLGGAVALVSLWTVFFLDIEALGLVGVISAAILTVMIWPRLPGRIPAPVWKLAVPAIIVVAAFDLYFSPDTLPVLIRLTILLVGYRTVSYRRKREDLQLIVLGLFLIVVAGVLTVSLGFAFLLLLFTACALGFLFVVNLIAAAETESSPGAPISTAWTRLDGRRFSARLRVVMDWRLTAFAAVLFMTVVVMSGLLFLIIPRFEMASGFFLDRYITRKSRTGFTESIKFGDVTELVRDQSVAMRVDLTDSTGVRERPYWRMVVLDEYTPQGFRVSPGLKAELLRGQRVTQSVGDRPSNRGVTTVGGSWTFYVEPGVSRFLPIPGSFANLRLRDPVPLQTSYPLRIVAFRTEPMAMAAFQLDGVVQTPLVADVRFAETLRDAQANPRRYGEQFRYNPLVNLRAPEGLPNDAVLRRIAGEISGGGTLTAAEFSRRATAWLQARHTYALSVKSPAGKGEDEIVRWLDSAEPGFCEYFAAGLAVLARTAGYPARLVTGFHGGALNAFENYYMVRNSDAHAWVEIFDGKAAWLRVDPTPGATGATLAENVEAARQEQDSSWSARFDSLRVLWYRRIVNFDSRAQVQMLEQVKALTMDSGSAVRAWMEGVSKEMKAWLHGPWDTRRLARTAGLLAGWAAGFWIVIQLFRRLWMRSRRRRKLTEFDPVRRKAGRWLTRLRASGGGNARMAAGKTDPVIAGLQRLRYGPRETWPEPGKVFREARRAKRRKAE